MHLEARIIRILWAKNYEYWFRFQQTFFETWCTSFLHILNFLNCDFFSITEISTTAVFKFLNSMFQKFTKCLKILSYFLFVHFSNFVILLYNT